MNPFQTNYDYSPSVAQQRQQPVRAPLCSKSSLGRLLPSHRSPDVDELSAYLTHFPEIPRKDRTHGQRFKRPSDGNKGNPAQDKRDEESLGISSVLNQGFMGGADSQVLREDGFGLSIVEEEDEVRRNGSQVLLTPSLQMELAGISTIFATEQLQESQSGFSRLF